MRTNAPHLLFLATLSAALLAGCSKTAEEPAAPPAAAETPPVAEAAPAPVSTSVKSFAIGDLQAFALKDGDIEQPNDNSVFGVGLKPEDVAALLTAAGQPTDKLHLSVQPLLVKSADKTLLFDTGASGNFGPGAGKLAASLAEANIDAASVTDVFISHSHGDHVGGLLNAEGGLAFPNAAIHISKPEWKALSSDKEDYSKKLSAAIKDKVVAFTPGADLVPGVVKAVEVKGHTPGHSAYLIGAGPDSILYVGDSMHHFVVSVQKPDWDIVWDADRKTGHTSRAALIADSAAKGQRIYAVHFPFPGIGKFEKRGEEHVWVAE
jgi:glyoxylase-like metal-dependent hydrolase (beta-lactamase superfamily II)